MEVFGTITNALSLVSLGAHSYYAYKNINIQSDRLKKVLDEQEESIIALEAAYGKCLSYILSLPANSPASGRREMKCIGEFLQRYKLAVAEGRSLNRPFMADAENRLMDRMKDKSKRIRMSWREMGGGLNNLVAFSEKMRQFHGEAEELLHAFKQLDDGKGSLQPYESSITPDIAMRMCRPAALAYPDINHDETNEPHIIYTPAIQYVEDPILLNERYHSPFTSPSASRPISPSNFSAERHYRTLEENLESLSKIPTSPGTIRHRDIILLARMQAVIAKSATLQPVLQSQASFENRVTSAPAPFQGG